MLAQLLDLVSQNRSQNCTQNCTLTLAQLGQRLGVPPALVEMMLADLEKAGYLRAVQGGESCSTEAAGKAGCSGCAAPVSCHPFSRMRLWVRTEKTLHE